MNWKVALAALVIAGAGYHFWGQQQEATHQQALLDSADANGFIELPPAAGVDSDKVLILAAPNCPKAGARRAAELAEALAARGIPFIQSAHISFKATPGRMPDRKRMDSVMLGPTPVVLIHGRGKANPSLQEVLAEYSGGDNV